GGSGRLRAVRFCAYQRAGVRWLALDKLLGPGTRGDLFQASRVRAHADGACVRGVSRWCAAASRLVAVVAGRDGRGLIPDMPGLPPKLVVTTYAPTRRMVTIVLLILLVAGGVYGMFEFGRYSTGFDSLAALRQRAALRAQIEAQEATVSELR